MSLNPAGHVQSSTNPDEWWAGADAPDSYHGHADEFPHRLGDSCAPLSDDHVRFLFGNINGLQLRDHGTRLRQIFREMNMLKAHHTGLVEINTNTRHSTAVKLLYDVAKDEFLHSVLTPANSQVDCQSLFKPGGVLSVTTDEFVGRLLDKKGSDHMGRWSYVKYAGKAGKVITVVTAYQVCIRPTNAVGNTAFHQQVQQIATEAQQEDTIISTPQPRLRFRSDLIRFLNELKRSGESIILMGDFNEDIGDSRLCIRSSIHPGSLFSTLGHYKAPAGHLPKQRAALHRAADALATMILRSFLLPAEARMVYFAIFLAKFSYVLPQCYFIPSVLRKIESKAQQAFTAKLGFSRKMSCAIRYGPPSLGGLGLVRLETIQGVGQILNFMKHWRSYSYIGSLLRCTLAWAQMNAGVSVPLLMIPSLRLVHFESKFIQSLRGYLSTIDATLEVDTPFVPPRQRENDVYIMDVATSAADFSVSDLRRLNFCRLFLQAVTASDIVLPTRLGDTIDPEYRHGDANLQVSPPTTYCHTTQAKPSKGSWNVWRRFCILLEQQLASNPLGDWTVSGAELRRVWQCYFDFATKLLYRRHPENESLFYRLYPTTDLDQEVFVLRRSHVLVAYPGECPGFFL